MVRCSCDRAMLRVIVTAALCGLVAAEFKLLVLHTNDMHSRFQPTDKHGGICEAKDPRDCYGGIARVAAVARMKKQEAKDRGVESIFLNAGDTFQGTPFYTFFKWKIVAEVADLIGFDAMSLGNHEFDDSIAGLAPFIDNVKTPQVCANVDISQEPALKGLVKSVVLERGGYKIGVIGYVTPDTTTISNTGKVIFQDEVKAINEECAKLKKQGVKIFIAFGHSGYTREIDMAKHMPDIDLIVGGHSHSFLYTPKEDGPKQLDIDVPRGPYPTLVTQHSGKVVPVVQAYFATKYLGYIELTFDDEGKLLSYEGDPILLTGDLPEDKQIVEVVKPSAKNIYDKTHAIVGFSKVFLDNDDMKCKLSECNVGNLVNDANVDYVERMMPTNQGRTVAAIALSQAGAIRASIDTSNNNGAITLEDVMTVLPWGKKVVINTITGKSLLQALEYSVTLYEQNTVGHVFLQVSGLKVVYDLNRPPQHRVVSVKAICTDCLVPAFFPVDPEKHYKIILPEYIASGGDGFTMLKSITDPIVLPKVDYMVLSDYISNHQPVYTAVEERITLIGAEEALKRGNDALLKSISTSHLSKTAIALIGGAAATAIGGFSYYFVALRPRG